MKTTNLEYTNIPVLLPSIDFFLEKIQNNEPFHFLRANHGIIDGMFFAYENNYSELETDILDKNYTKITKKIINAYDDKPWGLRHFHSNMELLSKVMEVFFEVLIEYKKKSSKFDIGLSLGVGLNNFWGVWPHDHRVQLGRTEIAKILTKTIKGEFYYSGVLKHYTIKREINKLFKILNDNDFLVVFLGPKYLYLYESKFNIKNFKHIQIPTVNAIQTFDEKIEEIKNLYSSSDKKIIVFHSCGHTLSFYLAEKLKDTNIFGVDIGRSFDILIKEHLETEPTMTKCWTFLDEYALNNYVDNLRK